MSTDPEAEAQRHAARDDREQLIWATFCAAGIEALAGTEGLAVAAAAAYLADDGLAEFRARWPA